MLKTNGTTALTINGTSQNLIFPSAALAAATAGAVQYDGKVFYATPQSTERGLIPGAQFYRLNSNLAGANVSTAQNVFGVGVTLSASTVYAFEAVYTFIRSNGTQSTQNLQLGFGGTATINNILYSGVALNINQALPATDTSLDAFAINTTAATTAVSTTGTPTNSTQSIRITGTVSINAGGTFIPQYTFTAALGASSTVAGSYFLIYPIGASGANISVGTWA